MNVVKKPSVPSHSAEKEPKLLVGKGGSMINIAVEPNGRKVTSRNNLKEFSKGRSTTQHRTSDPQDMRRSKQEKEIFYSSDSDLSHEDSHCGKIKIQKAEQQSQGQHRVKNVNYFEQPDSGFATSSRRGSFDSRDNSSLDRGSSVSLEDKLNEMEMNKLRKMCELTAFSNKVICDIDSKITESDKTTIPSQFVGFGLLPDQVSSKAMRKGFEFSLMVVGASGLGKSTLVNSLFLSDIYGRETGGTDCVSEQTLQVETHHSLLEENGVKLSLTVVDTPGFGENVDNSECWEPIVEYIEEQFDHYLEGETRVERVEGPDTRVHACLYFIAPTGHGLKPLDVEVMRRIHHKVNIIPVIGKADSCTRREINLFKNKILLQMEKHDIHIYDFPAAELEPHQQWMRDRLPFAVVGSNTVVMDEMGNKCRGREYPWGNVNIEDKEHCDFLALRNLVLASHMQDLRETTHSTHYENFRAEKLREMMGGLGLKKKLEDPEADITETLRLNLQDVEEKNRTYPQKEKTMWNMKSKNLGAILGGNRIRNIMETFKFK